MMEITVPEAAVRANRTQETIRRWIWSGRLPSRKVGNQHVIEEAELTRLIQAADDARWTAYFERRDARLRQLPPDWADRMKDVDICAMIDEDRDSH